LAIFILIINVTMLEYPALVTQFFVKITKSCLHQIARW